MFFLLCPIVRARHDACSVLDMPFFISFHQLMKMIRHGADLGVRSSSTALLLREVTVQKRRLHLADCGDGRDGG